MKQQCKCSQNWVENKGVMNEFNYNINEIIIIFKLLLQINFKAFRFKLLWKYYLHNILNIIYIILAYRVFEKLKC